MAIACQKCGHLNQGTTCSECGASIAGAVPAAQPPSGVAAPAREIATVLLNPDRYRDFFELVKTAANPIPQMRRAFRLERGGLAANLALFGKIAGVVALGFSVIDLIAEDFTKGPSVIGGPIATIGLVYQLYFVVQVFTALAFYLLLPERLYRPHGRYAFVVALCLFSSYWQVYRAVMLIGAGAIWALTGNALAALGVQLALFGLVNVLALVALYRATDFCWYQPILLFAWGWLILFLQNQLITWLGLLTVDIPALGV